MWLPNDNRLSTCYWLYGILPKSATEFDENVRLPKSKSLPDLNCLEFKKINHRQVQVMQRLLLGEVGAHKSALALQDYLYGTKKTPQTLAWKFGRLTLLAMSLFCIPMDGWRMYDGLRSADKILDGPNPLQIVEYYGCDAISNIIGFSSAINNDMFTTLLMRFLSTGLLHSMVRKEGDSSIPPPADTKEFQEYIKKKVPPHRLPKGMKYSDFGGQRSMKDQPYPGMKRIRKPPKKGKKLGKKKAGKTPKSSVTTPKKGKLKTKSKGSKKVKVKKDPSSKN